MLRRDRQIVRDRYNVRYKECDDMEKEDVSSGHSKGSSGESSEHKAVSAVTTGGGRG